MVDSMLVPTLYHGAETWESSYTQIIERMQILFSKWFDKKTFQWQFLGSVADSLYNLPTFQEL